MVFYAISEPEYQTSSWYKQIMDGLFAEKRAKRFQLHELSSSDDLTQQAIAENDVLLIIGTNTRWLKNCIQTAEHFFENRIIVLGNCEHHPNSQKYSIVTADVAHDVRVLYAYLKLYHKNRIALYGINPESASDAFKTASFLSVGGSADNLYYNRNSLAQCFGDFLAHFHEYDGVICVNDYAAISLVSHLKQEQKENMFITSCGGTQLSKHFSPSITNMKMNYEEFGNAAAELARLLERNPRISGIDIRIASTFLPGETTLFFPLKPDTALSDSPRKMADKFYDDCEIEEMMKIENLLTHCDETDFRMITKLLKNATYSELSDEFFMSVGGIKYKLKNMFDHCSVKSKEEFCKLLSKYIS